MILKQNSYGITFYSDEKKNLLRASFISTSYLLVEHFSKLNFVYVESNLLRHRVYL